jgi:spore germination cell wall hydrolase CwlJ-like protein
MGTPVSVKTGQAGSQIKGAIQGVKAPTLPKQDVSRGVTVPTATIKTSQPLSPSAARAAMGDVAPTPSIYKTVADADRAIVAKATQTYNQRFGTNYTPAQFSQLSKTVAGEAAGESDFGRAAVANTFVNRAALAQVDESPYGYMGGEDFAILADQYDAYRMQNAPYRAAVPGSKTYQQGVNAMYQAMNPESTFSKTASPKVLTATHYYNPAEVRREPDWARDKANFERVGSHLFGTAEASPKTVAKARAEQIARAGTTIVPTSSTPEESGVPTPRSRPPSQNMQRPPSAGIEPVKTTLREKEINDRLVNLQNPDGTRITVSVGNVYDSLVGSGVPEEDASRIANEMIAAPGNEYNIKSPPPGRPNERTLDAGLGRNPYDVQRAIGVPRARPPQPGLGRAAYDIERSPTQYSGIERFTPPQVTAGLSRNPFDTQTAGGYSGYGLFTPPVRTANLDRNVYDAGRTPSTYSGITDFNVPNRTADIARNQFDTRVSAPEYSGYGTNSVGLLPSDSSYKGVFGLAKSGVNALTGGLKTLSMPETYKMPEAAAEGLRNWGLAKGIETPKNLYEEAMSLYSDSQADADLIKAATPFAESLRNKVVSGVSGLQESYKNALSEAQKKSQPAKTDSVEPSGVTPEDDMPSVDTGTTKISVGPKLETIDKIVEDQKNLTEQEKDELKQILSEAASNDNVEWSTDDFNEMIDEAKRNIASGEEDGSYGLFGEEAADAAKKAGFSRNVYTNEDFLNDPDQLGLTREEIATPLSPEDMAKVVNRSRALRYDDVDPYLTNPEKVRAKVSDVVERIVTLGAPTKVAVGTAKKLMSIESPEKFLSRPSYEQQALYEYAREANTRYRPGETGVPQVGGPGNSGVIGGGSGLGGDGLGGGDKGNSGIAALVNKPKGDETTTPTPDTPSTSPGRRPDIYYMWDLGVNIPSPGDPNYTQYQTYLAERLAAQRAMG